VNKQKGNIIPDKDKIDEPALPVPRWLIALPLIGTILAAIMIAGSGPGPLTLGIFFISIFVAGYLYFYMINVWRARAARAEEGKKSKAPHDPE
jgi:hypothetical protein